MILACVAAAFLFAAKVWLILVVIDGLVEMSK
jgi:hypothetical protein